MKSIRCATVQMNYRPAIVIGQRDLIVEPFGDDKTSISLLSYSGSKRLKEEVRNNYITWIKRKVLSIIGSALDICVDVIVFPEYSIPPEILNDIVSLLNNHRTIVVAGTHMVTKLINNVPKGYPDPKSNTKKALAPILSAQGVIGYSFKHHQAPEEVNSIIISEEDDQICRIDERYRLAVRICIDAITSNAEATISDSCDILAIPSLTKNTTPFNAVADISKFNELPIIFSNIASIGGSTISAAYSKNDSSWFLSEPFKGLLPKETEGMIVADIDIDNPRHNVGTVKTNPSATIESVYNIFYLQNAKHRECVSAIKSFISAKDDKLNYKTIEFPVDKLYSDKLRVVKSDIENGISSYDSFVKYFKNITINDNEYQEFVKSQISMIINRLSQAIPTATSDENVMSNMGTLTMWMSQQNSDEFKFNEDESMLYIGRDLEKEEISSFLNSSNSGLIIKGLKGIGKTTLLSRIKPEIIPENSPWQVIYLGLTSGIGYEFLVDQIEYELKSKYFDKKSLSPSQLAERYLEQASIKTPTILEIDDIHLLTESNGRFADNRSEEFISSLFKNADQYNTIKIIATTNRLIPALQSITQITMSRLSDASIKAIIDYCYQKSTSDIKQITISPETLKYIYGNPLIAIIVAQFIADDKLLDLESEGFQEEQMRKLLGGIDLTDAEKNIIKIMSVSKTPVPVDFFNSLYPHLMSSIESLLNRLLLEFRMGMYTIHPMFKNFFYNSMTFAERSNCHKVFAQHYEEKFLQQDKQKTKNPIILSNLVFHLGGSLQRDKFLKYNKYIDELLPISLSLYKEKNYEEALQYFEIIHEHSKERTDILIKMARCYVYLDNAKKGEEYLNLAIEANPRGAYLYSSYSIALSGKGHYNRAKEFAEKAIETYEKYYNSLNWELAEIKFAYARSISISQPNQAVKLYDEACRINPTNCFYHCIYAEILLRQGFRDKYEEELAKVRNIDSTYYLLTRFEEKYKSKSIDDQELQKINNEDDNYPLYEDTEIEQQDYE